MHRIVFDRLRIRPCSSLILGLDTTPSIRLQVEEGNVRATQKEVCFGILFVQCHRIVGKRDDAFGRERERLQLAPFSLSLEVESPEFRIVWTDRFSFPTKYVECA